MTVKELIKQLNTCPSNAQVMMDCSFGTKKVNPDAVYHIGVVAFNVTRKTVHLVYQVNPAEEAKKEQ